VYRKKLERKLQQSNVRRVMKKITDFEVEEDQTAESLGRAKGLKMSL